MEPEMIYGLVSVGGFIVLMAVLLTMSDGWKCAVWFVVKAVLVVAAVWLLLDCYAGTRAEAAAWLSWGGR